MGIQSSKDISHCWVSTHFLTCLLRSALWTFGNKTNFITLKSCLISEISQQKFSVDFDDANRLLGFFQDQPSYQIHQKITFHLSVTTICRIKSNRWYIISASAEYILPNFNARYSLVWEWIVIPIFYTLCCAQITWGSHIWLQPATTNRASIVYCDGWEGQDWGKCWGTDT